MTFVSTRSFPIEEVCVLLGLANSFSCTSSIKEQVACWLEKKFSLASYPVSRETNTFFSLSLLPSRSVCRHRIYLVCSHALCLFYFLCLSHSFAKVACPVEAMTKAVCP